MKTTNSIIGILFTLLFGLASGGLTSGIPSLILDLAARNSANTILSDFRFFVYIGAGIGVLPFYFARRITLARVSLPLLFWSTTIIGAIMVPGILIGCFYLLHDLAHVRDGKFPDVYNVVWFFGPFLLQPFMVIVNALRLRRYGPIHLFNVDLL